MVFNGELKKREIFFFFMWFYTRTHIKNYIFKTGVFDMINLTFKVKKGFHDY